jgi:uncharacterized protein (TIGR00369 family)
MSIPQNLTYGVAAYETLRSMSGLEFLSAIRDGVLPQAPIARALGFWLSEVEAGRTVFEGVPTPDAYNPIGSVHGGWYGTLLDSCMACAVQTSLEPGTGYTTVEYSVNLVRAITVATGPVRAEGTLVHRGRRMATAEGRLVDGGGKLLAHGTTTCMIIDLPPAAS